MGLTTTLNANIYDGNNSSNTFSYAFKIRENSDLIVSVNNSVLNSGYTVTGEGSNSGGAVIFDTPPNSGTNNVSLVRSVPLTQLTSFPEGNKFPSSVVEETFDYAMMVAQQTQEILSRALISPLPDGVIGTLPTKSLRANKVLSFDGDGEPVALIDTTGDIAITSGTWLPVLSCVTPGDLSVDYAYQQGQYLRIGNFGLLMAQLDFTPTFTNATGSLIITGAPFAASGNAENVGSANMIAANVGLMTAFTATLNDSSQILLRGTVSDGVTGQLYTSVNITHFTSTVAVQRLGFCIAGVIV